MIGRVTVDDFCGVLESVTVIETGWLVAVALGVPEMAPVDGFMFNPAGRFEADHEYGVVPPVALKVAL